MSSIIKVITFKHIIKQRGHRKYDWMDDYYKTEIRRKKVLRRRYQQEVKELRGCTKNTGKRQRNYSEERKSVQGTKSRRNSRKIPEEVN